MSDLTQDDTFMQDLDDDVETLQRTLAEAQTALVNLNCDNEPKTHLATLVNKASGLAAQGHAKVDVAQGRERN